MTTCNKWVLSKPSKILGVNFSETVRTSKILELEFNPGLQGLEVEFWGAPLSNSFQVLKILSILYFINTGIFSCLLFMRLWIPNLDSKVKKGTFQKTSSPLTKAFVLTIRAQTSRRSFRNQKTDYVTYRKNIFITSILSQFPVFEDL